MGGALPATSVGGIGLQIVDKSEPDITAVTFLDRTKIYVRRTPRWKECIAEFLDPRHAELFLKALK